ncbi:hypothetical protein MTsPCn7_18570 [Altererythrobacter sp. MTPC7]
MDDGHRDAFREALGSFATGVTIATTLDAEGQPVGVTASSFNSVSLAPPLVLWSLAKDSQSRAAFDESGHFAIHVLAASQEELSNRFARRGADKFSGVPWTPGRLGSPVFAEHAALFECTTRHLYDGGDHVIMVGEVVDFEARDEAPLLFHGGRYADHRPRAGSPDETEAQRLALAAGMVEQALTGPLSGNFAQGDLDAALKVLRALT